MATRLFEGRDHAAVYQRYRFSPQENLQRVIVSYLEKKKVNSFHLAVDVGCGTGQSSHLLAKHFEKVVGTDISKAQIEEAKQATHPPNVSYLVCPAEELPFEDRSVDLLTAFTAAHWFDIPRFMNEVDRLLKPSGCVALSTSTLDMRLHYKDRSEKLTGIIKEIKDQIFTYAHEKVKRVANDYKEIFDSLPLQDKESTQKRLAWCDVTSRRVGSGSTRGFSWMIYLSTMFICYRIMITDILDHVPMSVADLMGYIQSFSPYQIFLKAQPDAAKSLVQNAEQRILETMGVSSRDTQLELVTRQVCVLGYKSS